MLSILIYGMVYLGSALMVVNILRYIQYIRHIQKKGEWADERMIIYIPLVLLVMFLVGYLVVGVFGRPDLVISGILFFGSVFVAIIVELLWRVTNRIQQNDRLEAELLAAEESNKAKTVFLSSMSHEIRTPMNAIIGLDTIALRNPDLPEETREQLEKIDASARHMLDLINNVLDMSRIESGRMELASEEFSFRGLVEQINAITTGQCEAKGLEYVFEERGPVAEYYVGDSTKLKQVLINIIGNSVKFTPAPGRISFTVDAGQPYAGHCPVSFIIKDTGIGMDEAFIPKIFEPFSQESSGSTSSYGGSGLGLSITKNIVDMMNGDISVSSVKGSGTEFVIKLTLSAAERAREAAEPASAKAAGPGSAEGAAQAPAGMRVLIAEDIDLNAEILADLLELEDVASDRAENGRAAVELFEKSGPGAYGAILMDMRMPVMDGLEAAKAIRALPRPDAGTVPIIALTANAFEEDVRRCLQAGMDAHLSKPVDPDQLFEVIRSLTAPRAAGS